MIRVLVVDDHALVRSGLRLLLDADPEITVEDEAESAEQAVRKARLDKPDVVLLDITMPGPSGLEVAAEIKRAAPKAAILILSMHDDSAYVREAFEQGASGYLLKEAADEELLNAVRAVAAGGQYLHPMLGARLMSGETHTDLEAAKHAAAALSQHARPRCCGCSPPATPTSRSQRRCSSRCEQPRRTGRTSCRSFASPPAPNSSTTPSSTAYSPRMHILNHSG